MDDVRRLLAAFRLELRSLLISWIAICVGVAILMIITGKRPASEAIWLGLGLLPMGVSFVPMLWMYAGWGAFGRGWRTVGIVLGWAVTSFIPAGAIAVLIWRLGGVN